MKSENLDPEQLARSAWMRGLAPEAILTVSEWADAHRVLSGRASAEPGPYRTDRTPYLRDIMDALSVSRPEQRVVFMKSAQVGATEAGNNWIGYLIHHAPAPMMAVMPTVDLAKRNSRQRIDPLIETCPPLRERVIPARTRDAGNTVLSKEFPAGVLVLTGANSAVGLRSMPARFLFLDEVDAYPASADEEGDPVGLVEARGMTFGHRRKSFLASTPTIRGTSRIEREYEASDQRRFFVPCPECGAMQWLKFERLRWEKGHPRSARYHCEACEVPIGEEHKSRMLELGEWRATSVADDDRCIGFHISALYSPPGWHSWSDVARGWESAQGNDDSLRVFRNTVLGETWFETSDAPDWERLAERREDWQPGIVPAGAVFLTAGIDIQKDRFEVDVWGWGRGLESWLVDHAVVEGGPDSDEAWAALSDYIAQQWRHENGHEVALSSVAVDTGYEATAVYLWARSEGSLVRAIKGVGSFNRAAPVTGPTYVDVNAAGRRLKRGAKLWTVAVSTFKSETYRFLRRHGVLEEGEDAVKPQGVIHLPKWADAEWLKQLVAEQLVTVRPRSGSSRLEWQKLRERNEALDCRVYARAAAWIAGVDRWSGDIWDELEAALAPIDPTEKKRVADQKPVRRQDDWLGSKKGGSWL